MPIVSQEVKFNAVKCVELVDLDDYCNPGSGQLRAGRHPGERRGELRPAPPRTPGAAGLRTARREAPGAPGRGGQPSGGATPARVRGNTAAALPSPAQDGQERAGSEPAGEAGFARKPSPSAELTPPSASAPAAPQRGPPAAPTPPEALPANAKPTPPRAALPAISGGGGRSSEPPGRGRHSPEAAAAPSAGAPASSLREGAPPPRPPSAPRRALPCDRQRCRAQRPPRGHGRARGRARGRVVPPPRPPPPRRLLLRRRRRLPSSGLCCNVCEADFERLARRLPARPPAAALLPPPPRRPRPSPSPRRSTPFSSSAKFLNPFFPLSSIVTGAAGTRSGPGGSRELRGPLGWLVFLLARPPAGRAGAAGAPRQLEERGGRERRHPGIIGGLQRSRSSNRHRPRTEPDPPRQGRRHPAATSRAALRRFRLRGSCL
ncbi:hypothetical protein R6Z07M_001230 [Ovis aries]